jgi:hypothetical protein
MRNQSKNRGLQTADSPGQASPPNHDAANVPSLQLRFLSIIGLIVDDFFADVAALVAERVWHFTPACCQLKNAAWVRGREVGEHSPGVETPPAATVADQW